MVYNILVHKVCQDLDIDYFDDFNITIDENIKDVVKYLFEKKYNISYRDSGWMLEKDAEKFVKSIEKSWWENTFDYYSLYRDKDFIKFILNDRLNSNEVLDEQLNSLEDEIKDDLISLERDDLEYYNYLAETGGVDISISLINCDNLDLLDNLKDSRNIYLFKHTEGELD